MLLRNDQFMSDDIKPPKFARGWKSGHFVLKNVVSQYIQDHSDSHDTDDLSIGFDELKEGLIREYNTELFKSDMQDASMAERLKKLSTTLSKLFSRNSDLFIKCMKTYTCYDSEIQSNSQSNKVCLAKPIDIIPITVDRMEQS